MGSARPAAMSNGPPGGLPCDMTHSDLPRWAAHAVPAPPEAGVPPDVSALGIALSGTLGPADVAALCDTVAELVTGGAAGRRGCLVVCDVGGLFAHSAATVDALARLRLTVGRLGCRIRFRGVPPDLLELLVLVGLDQVLLAAPADDPAPPGGDG